MEISWVEWYGYLASLIVLTSLTMNSLIKLRIFSFFGSVTFAHYGYLNGILPVMITNVSIAIINVYYLYQIFRTKERFKLINAGVGSDFYQHFIGNNQTEINKQVSMQKLQQANNSFYMLRDDNIAGILAGIKESNGTFTILLDYVSPQYRDFKLGAYYYKNHPEFLKEKGITILKAVAKNKEHCTYLEKMGFVRDEKSYKKIL